MKKITLAVFIALLSFVGVNAQATFGIKGGVNFASIMGDVNSEVNYRTSWNIGLVAEIETSSNTSVQPEIMYSGQGFKFGGGNVGGINGTNYPAETFKLDYLNIPIAFKYYVNEGFSIETGPQVGFLLSATSEGDIINDDELRDNLTNASFDWLIGLGYKFDNGFNVNARYVFGWTDIWKGRDLTPPTGWYYYDYGKSNSVFQLTVGYYFN
jgi:hypothetical protein